MFECASLMEIRSFQVFNVAELTRFLSEVLTRFIKRMKYLKILMRLFFSFGNFFNSKLEREGTIDQGFFPKQKFSIWWLHVEEYHKVQIFRHKIKHFHIWKQKTGIKISFIFPGCQLNHLHIEDMIMQMHISLVKRIGGRL